MTTAGDGWRHDAGNLGSTISNARSPGAPTSCCPSLDGSRRLRGRRPAEQSPHARHSAGRPPPRSSPRTVMMNRSALRRSLEFALEPKCRNWIIFPDAVDKLEVLARGGCRGVETVPDGLSAEAHQVMPPATASPCEDFAASGSTDAHRHHMQDRASGQGLSTAAHRSLVRAPYGQPPWRPGCRMPGRRRPAPSAPAAGFAECRAQHQVGPRPTSRIAAQPLLRA
jgi:hypothetical protein